MRSQPNTTTASNIVGLLKHGDEVRGRYRVGDWLRIDKIAHLDTKTGILGPEKDEVAWVCTHTSQHKDLVSPLTQKLRDDVTKFVRERERENERRRKLEFERAEKARKAELARLEAIRKTGAVNITLGGHTPRGVGYASKFSSKTDDVVPIKRLPTTVSSQASGLALLGTELLSQMTEMSGPKHWTPLPTGQNDALVELASWSDEYKEALRHFRKTCRNHVVKIERVQNHYLHQRYIRRKMMMLSSGKPYVNEMLLFHGTRNTPPSKIWDGLNACGFDPRLGSGYYGKGAYFAQNCQYSASSYAHKMPGNQSLKQLFLASVLIGEYKDYGTYCSLSLSLSHPLTQQQQQSTHSYHLHNSMIPYLSFARIPLECYEKLNSHSNTGTTTMNSLKRAPDLPSYHPHAPGLYDSVKGGPHSGTYMYIVYNADQSYPLYLYTFRA